MNRVVAALLILAPLGVVVVAGTEPACGLAQPPGERTLRQLLGDGTPEPIPLWPGKPPQFVENAPAETVDEHARVRMVSVPSLSAYLPPKGQSTGMALLICPGGGYGALDGKTHVVYKDITARTELPLKRPRSREPVLGGSRDKVFFQVWIPAGVRTVRGAVCNPFSRDEAVSKHWQAACRRWHFAYLQTDFDAVKKEEFTLLQTALAELARTTSHPEVEHLPFCWIGMSRGGGMSMQLAELMPERTIASVPVCLEVGPTSEAGRRIPVLTIFGEKDGKQMEILQSKLPIQRGQGARWAIAVQWGRKHEFALANNLAFVFFDEVIARRLPEEAATHGPVRLRDIPPEEGWLGDPATWGKDGRRPTMQSWKEFPGDRAHACWFPSQRVAAVWQAFVGGTREVAIREPAGLGDGRRFDLHAAARPITVQVTLPPEWKPEKVELWDADQRLAERTDGPWTFDAALKPGIHALIATVRGPDKKVRTSRPHTIVVAE